MKKIALIVENCPDQLELFATLVDEAGYQVIKTSNTLDAVAQIMSLVSVDLVITDADLGHGDENGGLEVVYQAREMFPCAEIWFTSGGRGGHNHFAMAKARGANRGLMKPTEILDAINELKGSAVPA